MRKTIILFAAVCCLFSCSKKAAVSSPDGQLKIDVSLTESGGATYHVSPKGVSGDLGFSLIKITDSGAANSSKSAAIELRDGFSIVNTSTSSFSDTWETTWGEEQYITDNHNELVVELKHSSGLRMDVIFRAFNDGFAFRYRFPEQPGLDSFMIMDEHTTYRFSEEPTAWSIPWRTEYYEAIYTDAPLLSKDSMCDPITLQWADGSYGYLHEAQLVDYPAQNFYIADSSVCTYLTPWQNGVKAYCRAPFQTPWRMLILTNNLADLCASRIMLNLNDPCAIDDTSWIRPMKFIGIWWGMHLKTMTWRQSPIHGATTENMERYLRFAAEHHIQAVLAEGWNKGWEGYEGVWPDERFSFVEPYSDYDIDYLSHLADSLGVEIISHHETSGQAGQYQQEMEAAYDYMKAHGITAVKTGYVSPIITTLDGRQYNRSQSGVRHYRSVIETAARKHVTIDNHEPVMPTGLQRTYPNLMTQEGIRGQEWNAWAADGGSPASHVCTLPFTRMLAGPADYTPGVFDFSNPVQPNTRVHATIANQLGLFVTMYSPLQMACDLPESYMKHPDAFRFIEDVPCDWKQSQLLMGEIGQYVVFARQDRHSDDWYIGGTTNDDARTLTLNLSFLPQNRSYTATIYRDAEGADWLTNPYAYTIETMTVNAETTLPLWLASGGGFAIRIEANK